MKRILLLVVAVAVGVLTAPRMRAQTPDLAGVYLVDGTNPDGKPYRGVLEIVQEGRVYHLRWTFPTEADNALGFGIVVHDALAVSYYSQSGAGIAVYPIEQGALGVGVWSIAGLDGTFTETPTRLPVDHPPPTVAPETPKQELGDPKKRLQG